MPYKINQSRRHKMPGRFPATRRGDRPAAVNAVPGDKARTAPTQRDLRILLNRGRGSSAGRRRSDMAAAPSERSPCCATRSSSAEVSGPGLCLASRSRRTPLCQRRMQSSQQHDQTRARSPEQHIPRSKSALQTNFAPVATGAARSVPSRRRDSDSGSHAVLRSLPASVPACARA